MQTSEDGINVLVKDENIGLEDMVVPSSVKIGDDWNMKFTFNSKDCFGECFFDVAILNSKREIVAHYKSNLEDERFTLDKGLTEIDYTMKSIYLNDDNYTIIVHLATKDKSIIYRAEGIQAPMIYGKKKYIPASSKIAFEVDKKITTS